MKRIKLTEAQIKMLQNINSNKVVKISESQFIRLFEDIAEIPSKTDENISEIRYYALLDNKNNPYKYYLGRGLYNPALKEYGPYSIDSPLRDTEAEVCTDFKMGRYNREIQETITEGVDISNAKEIGDPKMACIVRKEDYKPTPNSNKASTKITQNFKSGGKTTGIKFEAEDMERNTISNKISSVKSDTDTGATPHTPRPELKLDNKAFFKRRAFMPVDHFERFKEGYLKNNAGSSVVDEKDNGLIKGYRNGTTHVDWKYKLADKELHFDMPYNDVNYYIDTVKPIKKALVPGKKPRIEKEEAELPVGMDGNFKPQTVAQNEKTTQSFNETDIDDVPKILAMGEFVQYIVEFLKDLMLDETAKGLSPVWESLGQDRHSLLGHLNELGMVGTVPIHGVNRYKVYKHNFKENVHSLYNKIVGHQNTIEETTGAASSGAFVAPMGSPVIKRKLATENTTSKQIINEDAFRNFTENITLDKFKKFLENYLNNPNKALHEVKDEAKTKVIAYVGASKGAEEAEWRYNLDGSNKIYSDMNDSVIYNLLKSPVQTTTLDNTEDVQHTDVTNEHAVPKITMFSDEAGIESKQLDKEETIEEETTASSSGSYVTPKIWAKSKKDMKFGKKPMYPNGKIIQTESEAHSKTLYPDGEMVTFDDCVRPGHNDVNINGGCSTGAVDGVVKTKKTNGSIISKDALYYEVAKKTGRTIEEVKEIIKRNGIK